MLRMPRGHGSHEPQRWLSQLRADCDPENQQAEPDAGWEPGQGQEKPGIHQAESAPEQHQPALPGGAEYQPASPGGSRPQPSPARRADEPLHQPVEVTERAVIGDALRRPVVWCQLPPCISRRADPEATGEADARVRAVGAGWREDGFGRLVCPACQQAGLFWSTQPVIRWDRSVAVTMTSLMVAAIAKDAVGAAGTETGEFPAALPVKSAPRSGADRQAQPAAGRHRRR